MTDLVSQLRDMRICEGVAGLRIEAADEIERLQMALEAIAGFGRVNLAGEYEHGLRDIIRSMTDCAKAAALSSGDGR